LWIGFGIDLSSTSKPFMVKVMWKYQMFHVLLGRSMSGHRTQLEKLGVPRKKTA
jgi:hypothetical protein